MPRHPKLDSTPSSTRIKNRKITHLLGLVAAALKRIEIAPGSTILVGLSGGPDSVALIHALNAVKSSLRIRLAAAHLNHRLRGSEADRDEAFVRKLCAQLGIDLVVARARSLATKMPNLEERAREQRYRFLNRVADRIGAYYIALAHHADDQAETVLMRLLRGAGGAGLSAMAESGPARLIRPLLSARRSVIIDYLRAIGAEWVTDSSNNSTDLLRNRIRLELIPMLEREYATGFSDRLTALAEEMRGLDHFLTTLAQNALQERSKDKGLSLVGLADLDPVFAIAIVREYLREQIGDLRRINRNHLTAIRDLCRGTNPGGSIALPSGWRARREYEFLMVERSGARCKARPFSIRLKRSGLTSISANGFHFEAKTFASEDSQCPTPEHLTQFEALFDAAALSKELIARSLNHGDRIEPLGMRGSRKVQDLFVDRKLPRALRDRWPLVTAGGVIVWIPGMARSRHAIVTPETKKILYLRAFTPSGWEESSVA